MERAGDPKGQVPDLFSFLCLIWTLRPTFWPSVEGSGRGDPRLYQGKAVGQPERRAAARGGLSPTPW